MVENIQQAANFTRVRSYADPSRIVVGKDIVQNNLVARSLSRRSFAFSLVPQLVFFGEALLKAVVGRRKGSDLALGGAMVASMNGDGFTEVFLDDGLKLVRLGEIKSSKGDVGGLNAALQGRVVVGLKVGHIVRFVARLEEGVGLGGFCFTGISEKGVLPGDGAVASLFSPVTLI